MQIKARGRVIEGRFFDIFKENFRFTNQNVWFLLNAITKNFEYKIKEMINRDSVDNLWNVLLNLGNFPNSWELYLKINDIIKLKIQFGQAAIYACK